MKEIRYAITEQFKWSDKRLIMWSLRMSHHVISIITRHFLSQQIITACEMWPEYLVTIISTVQTSISILKWPVFKNCMSFHRVLGHKEFSQLDAYSETAPCNSNSLCSQIEKASQGAAAHFTLKSLFCTQQGNPFFFCKYKSDWWPKGELEKHLYALKWIVWGDLCPLTISIFFFLSH